MTADRKKKLGEQIDTENTLINHQESGHNRKMIQAIDLANVPVLVENLERQELEVKT